MAANVEISKEGFKSMILAALQGEDLTGTCNISIDEDNLVQALKELDGQVEPEPAKPKPRGGFYMPREDNIANRLRNIINSGDK